MTLELSDSSVGLYTSEGEDFYPLPSEGGNLELSKVGLYTSEGEDLYLGTE